MDCPRAPLAKQDQASFSASNSLLRWRQGSLGARHPPSELLEILLSVLSSCVVLGCSSKDEPIADACRVESAVRASYCVKGWESATCEEHSLLLDEDSEARHEVTDCRELGFTTPCEGFEMEVFVAVDDSCDDIDEAWAQRSGGGAGGAE